MYTSTSLSVQSNDKMFQWLTEGDLPTWSLNQACLMFKGGAMFKMCGFFAFFKYGRQAWELTRKKEKEITLTVLVNKICRSLYLTLTELYYHGNIRIIALNVLILWIIWAHVGIFKDMREEHTGREVRGTAESLNI